jgi:hypothetical protein
MTLASILSLGFALAFAQPAISQDSPEAATNDPPHYVFSGHRAGEGPGYKVDSLSNGDLHAENASSSFHSVALDFVPARDNLRFKYWCVYRAIDGTGPEAGPVTSGACPAQGAAVSHNIIAVRIELAGPASKRFTLRYSCVQGGKEFKDLEPGQWCGKPDAPKTDWIQKLDILLRRGN